jgi:PAS domain S-box-containing protein
MFGLLSLVLIGLLMWNQTININFGVLLLGIIILVGYVCMITSKWVTRKINKNINCLLILDTDNIPEFDYEEFNNVARLNYRLKQNFKMAQQQIFTTLENIVEGYLALDNEWRFTYINQQQQKILSGKKSGNLIGKCIWDEYPAMVGTIYYQEYHRAMTSQIPVHFQAKSAYTNRWFEVNVYPSKDGLSIYSADITEHKQYEQKLYELATIVESSADAIIGESLDGKIINWNPGAEKMFGYSYKEIIGQPVSILIPPELLYELTNIETKIKKGKDIEIYDTVRIGKNGKLIEVSVQISVIRDKNCLVTGAAAIYRDITALKRAESELLEEQERLLVTLNSIGDGVISIDEHGKVVLLNQVAERLTGWSWSEAVGKLLDKIFYIIDDKTSEPNTAIIMDVLNTNTVIHLSNVILVNRDLVEIPVSICCSPIKPVNDNHIYGMVLVFQDITEKQQMEMELLKTQKLESLGILAGGIAHDFNNVLAAILANLQLAIIKLHKGDDITKYLQDSVETTRKASELTKQLLTFAKGGAPVKKAASIVDLVKETVHFALRGSKIKAKYYFSEQLWTVEVDEAQINQVINNLIINAKQAMPKGGMVEIRAENVTFEAGNCYNPDRYVKISIQDYGVGIPKDMLNKIFDPFFTTKEKGTGLGLSTSYSIIKKHDGYIEVESQIGVGTTFYIYLPASNIEIVTVENKKEIIATGQGKLLLMDDEEGIRNVVGEMLQDFGYQVVLAKDGEEAIELYRKALENDPFEAVIMDLTVPGGMGGQEAVAILRDIDPKIQAIVSSGYANDPIMADYERYGFCGVVTKPFKFSELHEVLNKIFTKNESIAMVK